MLQKCTSGLIHLYPTKYCLGFRHKLYCCKLVDFALDHASQVMSGHNILDETEPADRTNDKLIQQLIQTTMLIFLSHNFIACVVLHYACSSELLWLLLQQGNAQTNNSTNC